MAKDFKDEFFEELTGKVIRSDSGTSIGQKIQVLSGLQIEEIKDAISTLTLKEQKEILLHCIAMQDSNVIKDPRTLEELKKELAIVNKKIKKESAEKAIASGTIVAGIAVEDEEEKSEDLDERVDDKKKKEQTLERKNVENEEKLKKIYYDSIVAYYDARLKTVKYQINNNELISSDDHYNFEIKLELEMYRAREAYIATGNDDPYEKFRAEHAFIDRQSHEPLEITLREKARKYREIESEISELDKETTEINEKLQNIELTDMQRKEYQTRSEQIDEERKKLELKKAEHKDIIGVLDKQKGRESKHRVLQTKHREAASKEEIKGYDYQRGKRVKAQHNTSVAVKTERNNVETRIAEGEKEIKNLKKQLGKVANTDLRLRLDILEKLSKETNKLQANRDQKEVMDKGYELSEADMIAETKKSYEKLEEEQADLEKETKATRAIIEEQDKKMGEAVVESPEVANVEERDRQASSVATMYAVARDSAVPQNDIAVQNIGTNKDKCVIPGLEGQVKSIDNTEEGRKNAEEYLEQDEQIRKAAKELDTITSDLTQY